MEKALCMKVVIGKQAETSMRFMSDMLIYSFSFILLASISVEIII